MASGEGDSEGVQDEPTREFLRSFTVVDYDSEDEFDVLSPIPETPADLLDGDLHGQSTFLYCFLGGRKSLPLVCSTVRPRGTTFYNRLPRAEVCF